MTPQFRIGENSIISRIGFVGFAVLVLVLGCEPKRTPEPLDCRRPGEACKLHGAALEEATARIDYGLPDKDYLKAREELFPNAEAEVLGGCVEKEPKSALV